MSGERIFRPFILILTFIVLLGFLFGMCAKLFSNAATMEVDEDITNVLGDWEVDLFDPTAGYTVTNASVYDEMPTGEVGGFTFGDDLDKRVYVVRDNKQWQFGSTSTWEKFQDYIGIKRKASDLYKTVHRVAIPLQRIYDKFSPETNISRVDFTMSGSNYTLYVKLMDNNTQRIEYNNYTIYLGKNLLESNKVDFWSAIRMILFADIPNCNPIVSVMVSVIVDFSLIFIAIQLAMRIFPFGGGG